MGRELTVSAAPTPSQPAPASTRLEAILRRDRRLVIAGLVAVAVLAWAYMLYLAWEMGGMDMEAGAAMGAAGEMAMPQMRSWSLLDLVLMFVMWAVMMVAMMVPSASPMVLLFAKVMRQRSERQAPYVPVACFLGAYVLVWASFSVGATTAQWALHEAALLSPMMVATSPVLGGLLLVAAGIFQWTPLKRACLVHCRSPLHFFMTDWRSGRAGAFIMGWKHGLYCTGCCWLLMALLFVAGVMNLLWVAAIAVFVLSERIAPKGDLVGRLAGLALVTAGVLMGAGVSL